MPWPGSSSTSGGSTRGNLSCRGARAGGALSETGSCFSSRSWLSCDALFSWPNFALTDAAMCSRTSLRSPTSSVESIVETAATDCIGSPSESKVLIMCNSLWKRIISSVQSDSGIPRTYANMSWGSELGHAPRSKRSEKCKKTATTGSGRAVAARREFDLMVAAILERNEFQGSNSSCSSSHSGKFSGSDVWPEVAEPASGFSVSNASKRFPIGKPASPDTRFNCDSRNHKRITSPVTCKPSPSVMSSSRVVPTGISSSFHSCSRLSFHSTL